MKNVTRCFVVLALAGSGFAAFACGGGDSTGGGATTPTASTSAAATSDTSSAVTAASTTAPVTSSAPAAVPAPPLVVVAMKLSIPKAKSIEVKDDGSILVDGKPAAKFVGADLQDKDGKTMLTVAADGSITSASQTKEAKFNAKDELEVGGGKVWVGDDGIIKLTKPDGQPDKDSGKAKYTGFKPAARRAATVLAIAMLTATSTLTAAGGSAAAATTAKK